MRDRRPDHGRAPPPSSQNSAGARRPPRGTRSTGLAPTHASPGSSRPAAPCSVSTDSGWNCTPSSGRRRCARPSRPAAGVGPAVTARRRGRRGPPASGSGPRSNGDGRPAKTPRPSWRTARPHRAPARPGRPAAVRRDQPLHPEADAEHRAGSPPAAPRARPRSPPVVGVPGPGREDDVRSSREHLVRPTTSSCWTTSGSGAGDGATRCTRFHVYESWWSTTRTSGTAQSGPREQPPEHAGRAGQVVAVLGEDRLGVELDAPVVRARPGGARRRSPGRRRPRRPSGSARRARPGRRRCCRSRPARSRPPISTGDWVPWKTMSLYVRGIPSWWHSAWWPRQTARNGCPVASSVVDGRAQPRDLGVVAVARVTGPGADDDEVVAVEARRRRSPRAGPPRWSCRAPPSTWRSMLTKSSSPSRITARLPASRGSGRRRPGR